jgi:succinate dehydrogenase hydrophobic anchor subunit
MNNEQNQSQSQEQNSNLRFLFAEGRAKYDELERRKNSSHHKRQIMVAMIISAIASVAFAAAVIAVLSLSGAYQGGLGWLDSPLSFAAIALFVVTLAVNIIVALIMKDGIVGKAARDTLLSIVATPSAILLGYFLVCALALL